MKNLGFFLCLFLLSSATTWAGGSITISTSGNPAIWSGTVELAPEAGSCATFTNAQMVTKLNENVQRWPAVSGVDPVHIISINTAKIVVDINKNNYQQYYVGSSSNTQQLNDGINPVMFDDDGEIIAAVFGSANKENILGGAGPDGFSDITFTTIIDAQAIFNCRCLAGSNFSCAGKFTEADLDFTTTHEIGHLQNMDHTQANQEGVVAKLPSGGSDAYCDANPSANCDAIPTMYPVSVAPKYQKVLARDDQVAFLNMYGSGTWKNNFCTVKGTLNDKNGKLLRCADVQATTSDPADTIAFVSGAFAVAKDGNGDGDTADSGECTSGCGDFQLNGLDPAKTYTITVKPIDSAWQTAGSTIAPCEQDLVSGIVEEVIATQQCAAGSVIDLGTITTKSSGGTTTGTGGGDDGSSGLARSGCSLVPDFAGGFSSVLGLFFFSFLGGLGLIRSRCAD